VAVIGFVIIFGVFALGLILKLFKVEGADNMIEAVGGFVAIVVGFFALLWLAIQIIN